MTKLYIPLVMLSAISFLWYGYHCLNSAKMKREFTRFRLTTKQRQLTGITQILGGLSLMVGLAYPIWGVLASGGLTVQMLLGFLIRLKIKDSVIEAAPSFIFMILNGMLFLYFLQIYL